MKTKKKKNKNKVRIVGIIAYIYTKHIYTSLLYIHTFCLFVCMRVSNGLYTQKTATTTKNQEEEEKKSIQATEKKENYAGNQEIQREKKDRMKEGE